MSLAPQGDEVPMLLQSNEEVHRTRNASDNEPVHRLNVGGEKISLADMGPIIVVSK